jgi:hypothetical protein
MDSKFFKILFIKLFLLMISALPAFSQGKNYKILIAFNSDEDAINGLPIKSPYGECSLVSGKDSAWLFQYPDSSKISLTKTKESISFVFNRDSIIVEGGFIIPPCRGSWFFTALDIESHELVLQVEEYYLPIRTGTWRYKNGKQTREVVCRRVRIGDDCK